MATFSDRTPENVPGRYYIDASCIDCDQCRQIAPEIFGRNEDTALGYVMRQPMSEEEIELAEEALATCATDSIGRDGA